MRLAKEESIGRFRCANLSVVFVARSVTGLLPWLPSAVQFTRAVPLHFSLFTLHCLLPSAVCSLLTLFLFTFHFSLFFVFYCPLFRRLRLAMAATDRKSTRLNSSHVKIS